jgi:hypothetical protein
MVAQEQVMRNVMGSNTQCSDRCYEEGGPHDDDCEVINIKYHQDYKDLVTPSNIERGRE